jgi:hypothetical protein
VEGVGGLRPLDGPHYQVNQAYQNERRHGEDEEQDQNQDDFSAADVYQREAGFTWKIHRSQELRYAAPRKKVSAI